MSQPHAKSTAGELAILRRIRALMAGRTSSGLRLGIGDDCALLRLKPGEDAAVTTDLSIAGRHFRLDCHTPEIVGHRTLARGLSDLAAMGARPVAAFISLGLPRELTIARAGKLSWLDRFYDGLLALAEAYDTPLGGGDLAQSPLALADVVLIGAVPRGRALLRSGACGGHLLYVTGALGGAAAGLERLGALAAGSKRARPPRIPSKIRDLLAPHLAPLPRIAQGLWLRKRGLASAAIDLSDGLSTDLAHLCEESGVAAEIDAAALPIHRGASLQQALHGGEDYELLFTAPPTARIPSSIAGVPITRIGRMLKRRGGRPAITLHTEKGQQPLQPQGWQHFSSPDLGAVSRP
jgi:thiamine-monophosphate kinase